MTKFSFLPLILFTTLIVSCQKDNPEVVNSTDWTITEFIGITSPSTLQTLPTNINYLDSLLLSCVEDNQYRFDDNGNFEIIDNGDQCNGTDLIGTWSLEGTDQEFLKIELDEFYFLTNFEIGDLNLSLPLNKIPDAPGGFSWDKNEWGSNLISISLTLILTDMNGQPNGTHIITIKFER